MIRENNAPGNRLTKLLSSGLARWTVRRQPMFEQRTTAIMVWLENNLKLLAIGWVSINLAVFAYKYSRLMVPVHGFWDLLQLVLPYAMIAASPVAGVLLGRAAFQENRTQPYYRLSRFGNWQGVEIKHARSHPLFGPAGLLTSLVAGFLLGVVMRTIEFVSIMPAINHHAPDWVHTLFVMTTVEIAVMNFFYMICFIMAVKCVPLFPRMLLYVWMLDVLYQLSMAHIIRGAALPEETIEPLRQLLTANLNTVLISAAIWLPYLILSERVNVTFRHRVSSEACKA